MVKRIVLVLGLVGGALLGYAFIGMLRSNNLNRVPKSVYDDYRSMSEPTGCRRAKSTQPHSASCHHCILYASGDGPGQ